MSILGGIGAAVAGKLVDAMFGNVRGIFKDYHDRKISEAQLKVRLHEAVVSAFTQIEVAHSESISKTFASFMDAAQKSKLMQCVWASAALSQLVVLLWHQMGIPALCFYLGKNACYPSSGTTVEWAYAILIFCLGGGAIVFRAGPAAASVKDVLKSLVSR